MNRSIFYLPTEDQYSYYSKPFNINCEHIGSGYYDLKVIDNSTGKEIKVESTVHENSLDTVYENLKLDTYRSI